MNSFFRFLLSVFFTSILPVFIFAQGEITGTVIYYDRCTDTQYPVANAFDNDTETYFRSCATFGNWIGLDLGEKHIITKVALSPRMDSDYRDRLQLGIIEGANQPDFSDALPLTIVPGLTERRLNELLITCSRGFRYVRFVFPTAQVSGKSNYMSELKFYGTKGEGDDSRLPQLTNLPTVSIRTENAQDITSKDVYLKGTITIVHGGGSQLFTDSLEIRGRGNNSWSYPKKPYRIKLAESTRLLGMPAKARNWTLINNYGDKTLMRNLLAFDFSRRLEMPYTSPAKVVDVVLNGDYRGTYNLCDHIDVRKNRVEIEEMSATDLTGGYLIEIDAYANAEPKKFTSQQYSIPVSIKYPDEDEITLSQEQYIAGHFNNFTQAVAGNQYSHPEIGYRKYLDMWNFYRHFLVGEFSGNTDTYWSVRMWKKRDDDKLYFGPVWDFDLGFENDHRTYSITDWANSDNQWVSFSNRSSGAGGTKNLVRRILGDENALIELEKTYAHYRNLNVISGDVLTAKVDEYAELLNQTQQLNFKRWNIMLTKVHENPVIHGSYEAEVDNVRNYISQRIEWMDSKLNYSLYLQNPNISIPEGIHVKTDRNLLWVEVVNACEISVFDISGKKVTFSSLSDYDAMEVQVNSGIYILQIRSANKPVTRLKCIVP